MDRSFSTTHRQVQHGIQSRLHQWRKHGVIRGVVYSDTGQIDESLPFPLFECFRIGHDGFEYRIRRVILGQQVGQDLEFPKIQSENCLLGRESQGSKELKWVYLNILPNSAFGCPTHDLHGFSLEQVGNR